MAEGRYASLGTLLFKPAQIGHQALENLALTRRAPLPLICRSRSSVADIVVLL